MSYSNPHWPQPHSPTSYDALREDALEALSGEQSYVHESSYVDAPCRIGRHTAIMHFSHVMANSIIGDHCFIGQNVTIGSGVLVGHHVKVMNNTLLNSGAILENEVYLGPSTIVLENHHVRSGQEPTALVNPTLLKRGAKVGPNSTIVSGAIIGKHAFVEAGSVIDRNIPDFAVVYGNPIQFAGWRCRCGTPLAPEEAHQTIACPSCHQSYQSVSMDIELFPSLTMGLKELLTCEARALDSHSGSETAICPDTKRD